MRILVARKLPLFWKGGAYKHVEKQISFMQETFESLPVLYLLAREDSFPTIVM